MSLLSTTRAFRAVLLGAWATYLSLVRNAADALKALGVLGDGFATGGGPLAVAARDDEDRADGLAHEPLRG